MYSPVIQLGGVSASVGAAVGRYLGANPDIGAMIGRRAFVVVFELPDGDGDDAAFASHQRVLDDAQSAVAARAIFVADGEPVFEGRRLRCRDDAFIGYVRGAEPGAVFWGPDGRRALPPTEPLRALLSRPPFTRPEPPALITLPRIGEIGVRHVLRGDADTTIGGDPASSIVVAGAAPCHAILSPVDNPGCRFIIRDAGSDPVLVNDRPVKSRGVEHCDLIGVAGREFVFLEFR